LLKEDAGHVPEDQKQVFVWIKTVRFSSFNNAVHSSTGCGSFRAAAEEPIFPSNREGADTVFSQVAGLFVGIRL
jgi:hypothetical protein